VQPDLERFLDANDVAELVSARRAIQAVDGDDAQTLHVIVADWRDEQAAVNLLMFPELLPDDDRTPALAEGLCGTHGDDAVLAACVGLAAWVAADDDAPAIAERLLLLVTEGATQPAAERATERATEAVTKAAISVHASVALGAYAEHVAPTDLVCALVHRDAVVRHNVLAAALGGWGGVETLAALRAAADAGLVPRAVAADARTTVVSAGLGDVDEAIAHGRLVEPMTMPIPALVTWSETAAAMS
jgi:hypothetical protein